MEYLKSLCKAMGFSPENDSISTWIKTYSNHNNYTLKVNLNDQNIDYGNLITLGDKTTCNFRADENFVILECVNRLLEKGYSPKNIILEQRWSTGHGTSGKLDILVTNDDGSSYLMIECKTYGIEFDKELKRIFKNGGQLFTYFQQDKKADVLMLYSSEMNKKETILYRNEIIRIENNYKQTGSVQDFYDCWNKLTKNNGVFDSWVKAYDFQSKALTPKNLNDITQEDSSFIFNQFLEILRHNVVSDKPNAFNKIFTLFLCKIYDEKVTKSSDELAFQWFYTPYRYNGVNYPPDCNISFQKRLTDLYKKGMKEFLDKKVTDISDAEIEERYGSLSDDTRKQILDDIVELRLKKNNEFAIKEVFDDSSFQENAKIVKEVVELLQGYKIRYTKKQQYLSDFFELLLTTGLKQESGQFFTPVPIAQFIIKSLPFDKIIQDKLQKGEKDNLLPTIIDYAAGSGHFITESMHEMQRILNITNHNEYIPDTAKKIKSWQEDHFDWAFNYVYGIEKDYRLVKVSKVGCYLHGDGLARIFHSDGLGNFSNTLEYDGLLKRADKTFPKENKQFDIVVSNPPYSVSAFKNNSRKYFNENDFELYNYLTDQSSEIECLFVERTKQLLKDGGIAAVVLPSSILSNTGLYTKTREIILNYFEIIAIAEFDSNTFMATGTNTITLFMRRRNNYDCQNINIAVKDAISYKKDSTINKIEQPISKYVSHVWQGVTYGDYVSLLERKPNLNIESHEIYLEYRKKLQFKNEKEFWDSVIKLEQEKILYFILTYLQKIVLVKTGAENKGKQFLGYEFSNRRGNEGIHPTQRGKTIDECTKLFDPDNFENPEKASAYIYRAFNGDFESEIHVDLQQNITRHALVDMLTFDRADFEKSISIAIKKKVNYEAIWHNNSLKTLSSIALIQKGTSLTKDQTSPGTIPVIAGGQKPAYFHKHSNRDGATITVSASGAYAGFVNYFDTPIFASDCNTIKSKDEDLILTKIIFYFLQRLQPYIYSLQRGQAQPHVYNEDLQKIQIPLPPISIQKKIITEVEILEREEVKAKEVIQGLKNSIFLIIENSTNQEKLVKLGDVTKIISGGTPDTKNQDYWDGEINWATLRDAKNKYLYSTNKKITVLGMKKSGAVLLPVNTLIFSSRATIGEVCITKVETCTNQGFKNFICSDKIHYEYLYHILSQRSSDIATLASGMTYPEISKTQIADYKIPLPAIQDQQKIIGKIEAIEAQITVLKQKLIELPRQKEMILKRHLK